LDFTHTLLEPSLSLDSLDLAEIMAAIEHKYGKSPFEARKPPRTWQEIADFVDPTS
jgi:acyl carrier protein